ncbi:nitrite reductase small subunit NirD [Nocardiopsis halophila]|uniref:nitrite reductase small subunit NirD n=1 Tax=Nocardiopsis halophila TaxID=141692 RepID=UPI000346C4D0|nr:nitrite reductase small subunit NirD [Nocardiopsis halophila]
MTAITETPAPAAPDTWTPVCASALLAAERGAAVLLPGGAQAAVFRSAAGGLYAVSNIDPYTGAAVIARGIMGDRAGEPTVASPLLKHVFSLRTGRPLDAEGPGLACYPVRESDGRVEIDAGALR